MNLQIAVSIDDVCNDLVFELRASTDPTLPELILSVTV